MSFRICCVPGCSSHAEDTPLHCFPNPEKDVERFRLWIMNIGGEIISLDNNYIFKNRRVCHKHFLEKWHYTKNRLSSLAVPTLNLAGILASTSSNPQLPQRSIVNEDPPEHHITPAVCAMPTLTQESAITTANVVQQMDVVSAPTHQFSARIENRRSLFLQNTPATYSVFTQTQNETMSRSEIEMSQTINKLRRQMSTSKQKFMERLKIAKKSAKHLVLLNQKMSKPARCFVEMQISQAGKEKQGRRFTLKQKILALSLYKNSPKAYRLLSNICLLPQRNTLNNLLKTISLKPGINIEMFDNLKRRVKNIKNKSHRYCTVVFDEMAIAPHLDIADGKIIGFVDDGESREPDLADHVLVFMVRGVIKKFKQAVQYTFCAGTTKTPQLKKLIKSVVTQVQRCGLKVVATICDQGATNVAAINSLLKETKEIYLRNGLDYPEGVILINNEKIYPLYDPPHLIKGIRNNLLNKDLTYTYKGKKCVAKWDHIVKFHKKGPGFEGVRIASNLTLHHVIPRLIPKMRVRHCTQVFSSTVAAALGFSADAGILPEEAKETAKILLVFDQLFDSVNGSFSAPLEGKKYRAAVTPTSPHHKLWRESLEILKTMKYVDKQGKESIVPTLSSWIKTIKWFQMLCNCMFKLKERSLLLRHFNQDPLENFFGAVRSHGYSNIMPTAAAFQAAYKTLLVNNMTAAHSVGANCEKDGNECLQNLNYFFIKKPKGPEPRLHQHIDLNVEHLNLYVDVDALLKSNLPQNIEKCAAIGYCSGWLIRLAKKKIYHNCDTCTNQLESMEKQDFHNFIKLSEYSDKTWLCYPTKNVFDFFVHIEMIVREIMKTQSHKENVIEYIKVIVSTIVNYGFITCLEHKTKLTEYLINKNVLFCVNNWCKEVNKILSGKSENTDESDPVKVAAQHHYMKNRTKKRKRATGETLSV